MTKKYSNILNTIGNTPIVPITNIIKKDSVKIFAKLEYFNPGGSIKDRAALSMIEEAEEKGELTKDKTIIEATSGNTGIGLALVAAVKGYSIVLTISDSASEERKRILSAMGADLVHTPSRFGTDGAIEEAYKMARENPEKYWLADQFNNEGNWRAHYNGTAVEIWEQTGGKVTVVVAPMGTTGTIMGISKKLREYNATVKIVGIEPYLGHNIQGMKNMKESYRPEIFDSNLLDTIIHVEDEEAFQMARRLAKEEGIFVGMSSGAAMAGALKMGVNMKDGLIVVILPDGGDRYLSTNLFMDRKKTDITLFNTLSRRKDSFSPIKEGKASIYSCGPTVSRLIGIGECRKYIAADLLRRYLEYKGLSVKHVLNITDLDDNTIQGSDSLGEDLKKFTRNYFEEFLKDMDSLNIKRATHYPLVSEHVEEMIEIAQKLLEKGYAYERLRSVYFDISRLKDYGRLSKVDLKKIKTGKTVNLDQYEKDNPRDFTLLKRSTLKELKKGIFYSTKWGNIRPSWHIECATMAMKYFGETCDIQTGSMDMIFPHHENDIAISEAITGKPIANYWIHSELIKQGDVFEGQSGKIIPLRDIFIKGFSGREIRYFLISTHYRKTIDFSWVKANVAKNTIARLDRFVHKLRTSYRGPHINEIDQMIYNLNHRFVNAMDDDLNISHALAALFEFIHQINSIIDNNGLASKDRKKVENALSRLNSVLMIMDLSKGESSQQIDELVKNRDLARQKRDWYEADKLRDTLLELGVEVIDTPRGSTWRKKV